MQNQHREDLYLATKRKLVRVLTLQEVGPPSLLFHYAAGSAGRLAQGLAGQLHFAVLTLWHVNSTQ